MLAPYRAGVVRAAGRADVARRQAAHAGSAAHPRRGRGVGGGALTGRGIAVSHEIHLWRP